MKTIASFIFICFSFLTLKGQTFDLLIGTYTKPGKSDGIYVYTFNSATGEFTYKAEATGIKNPSYLTVTKDRKHVYAVSETDNGSVNAYSFDAISGKLTFLNSVTSGGSSPCYVSVDNKNKVVYTGNYGGGNLTAIPLKTDGSLSDQVQTIQHEGKGIKNNQEKPHVHATVLSKDDKYLFVPDLGTDKVNIYRIDASNPKPLTAAAPPFISVEGGNGPRHITFNPAGNAAYLIQEMTGVITAYDYADGKLTAKQSVTAAPASFTGRIDAADIHVSPDNKFLYGSLRGDLNEIVIYSIDKKGALIFVGRQPVLGKTPRNFEIDPTGNYLLVANQNSDDIIVFKRDQKAGTLKATGKKISLGSPVCLKFVSLK